MGANRKPITWVAAAAGAGVCAYLLISRLPLDAVVGLLTDDSFYYYTIARNIVMGRGSTFDGIAPTNGFHPLWMAVMLPIFSLLGTDPELAVRAVATLGAFICAGTLLLVFRTVEQQVGRGFGWISVAWCLQPIVLRGLTNGLDVELQLLLIALFVYWYLPRGLNVLEGGCVRAFVVGVFLGVITLARLDSVFILLTVALFGLVALGVRFEWRRLLRLVGVGLGCGLIVAPYLAYNAFAFGSPMPISGMVKSTFPHVRIAIQLSDNQREGAILLAVIAAFWLVLVFVGRRWNGRVGMSALWNPVVVLSVACGLHFLHEVLFIDWGSHWWRFAFYGLTGAFLLPVAAQRLFAATGSRCPSLMLPCLAALLALLMLRETAAAYALRRGEHREWLTAAAWVQTNTPTDSVVAMRDAGIIGYFSGRRVVCLDGKANGREYFDYLNRGRVEEYLRKVGVDYLAHIYARYREGVARIPIPRPNRLPVTLSISEKDEVFRCGPIPSITDVNDTRAKAHLAIWRFRQE